MQYIIRVKMCDLEKITNEEIEDIAEFINLFGCYDIEDLEIRKDYVKAKYLKTIHSNSSEEYKRLIKKNGWVFDPIILVDGFFLVSEGNHRVNSAKEISNDFLIPCIFVSKK